MKSFVLIFYGNSGSSWLLNMVAGDPAVYIPGYEPVEHWAWRVNNRVKLDWIRSAFSAPTERSGPVFEAWLGRLAESPQFEPPVDYRMGFDTLGFKLSPLAVSRTRRLLGVFKDFDTRIIVLNRANRVKHAVSLYRYHQEGKSQFDPVKARAATQIEPAVFDHWIAESTRLHESNQAFTRVVAERLPADRLLTVEYEDFISSEGKAATRRVVSAFLETNPGDVTSGAFKKATSDDLRLVLDNFDELRERYQGSPLLSDFDS